MIIPFWVFSSSSLIFCLLSPLHQHERAFRTWNAFQQNVIIGGQGWYVKHYFFAHPVDCSVSFVYYFAVNYVKVTLKGVGSAPIIPFRCKKFNNQPSYKVAPKKCYSEIWNYFVASRFSFRFETIKIVAKNEGKS